MEIPDKVPKKEEVLMPDSFKRAFLHLGEVFHDVSGMEIRAQVTNRNVTVLTICPDPEIWRCTPASNLGLKVSRTKNEYVTKLRKKKGGTELVAKLTLGCKPAAVELEFREPTKASPRRRTDFWASSPYFSHGGRIR